MKINVIASKGFLYPELCYNRTIHIRDKDIYIIPEDIEPHTIFFNSYDVCELDFRHRVVPKDDVSVICHYTLSHCMNPLLHFYKEFDNIVEAEDWFINKSREELNLRLHGKLV